MDETLGLRIRLERTRQGLKQKVLAAHAGLSAIALYQIEHDRTSPTALHLKALADALGVSMDYLAGRTGQRAQTTP